MEVAGIGQEALAQKMHKSIGTVNARLALLSLPQDIRDLLTQGKISIRAALEVGRVGNDRKRLKIAAKAEHLVHEELQARVQKAIEQKHRKQYERRAPHPTWKDLFVGLPVKRIYKDQVTFVFKDEEEFFAALRTLLERHDFENHAA